MKRKRYPEEQIIAILKEHEAGASMPDLARRHGVLRPVHRPISRRFPPSHRSHPIGQLPD